MSAAAEKAVHDKAAADKVTWEKTHPARLTAEEEQAAHDKMAADELTAKKVAANWKAAHPDTFVVDNFDLLEDEGKADLSEHPLLGLKPEHGMFVPAPSGVTVHDLAVQLRKDVQALQNFGAQVEKDVNGDTLLETVTTEIKKRNDDGSVMMSAGRPILSSASFTRPKMIHTHHFSVHPIAKGADIGGHKAPADGVLVVRRA